MKKVIIIGSGGQGKEVFEILSLQNSILPQFEILGFVDDDKKQQGTKIFNKEVIGGVSDLKKFDLEKIHLILGIGNPKSKKFILKRIEEIHEKPKFVTAIHPNAIISPSAKIGVGTIIAQGGVVSTNATVGDHVLVNYCASIGHDTFISDFCSIQPGARINGNAIVEEGAYIGTGSSLNQQLKVGQWAVVGNGAAVIKNVPQWSLVVGVPAKVKKKYLD